MGSKVSKNSKKKQSVPEDGHSSSGWRRYLSGLGIPARLCHLNLLRLATWHVMPDKETPVPERLLPPVPEKPGLEWTLPGFISIFLPEFPHRRYPGHEHLQILGFVTKGSYGPILKVEDRFTQKTFAIKVLPKSEILKHGVVEQSKEEVIIQRQVRHPFLHNLQDCWQTQRHLFIMCDYCSAGDLYTYWVTKGQLGEDVARVFAAELGCALGFLHDFGIIHRDVKMENILLTDQGHIRLSDFGLAHRLQRGGRAFTICGTIQYMAPEVLSGGPYNHAADWWSLGILLFSLVAGKFPVSPDPEHSSMLRKVHSFQYVMPATFSPPLALLLTELLCKTPIRRLRSLERFKRQTFFRGTSFDSQLLQKAPVELILQLKSHPDRLAQAQRGLTPGSFQNFDCDLLYTPDSPSDLSPTLTKIDLSPGLYSETDTPVTP